MEARKEPGPSPEDAARQEGYDAGWAAGTQAALIWQQPHAEAARKEGYEAGRADAWQQINATIDLAREPLLERGRQEGRREAREEARRREDEKNFRLRSADDYWQLVEVYYEYWTKSRGWEWRQEKYSYKARLMPALRTGEVVVIPDPWDSRGTRLAVVASLGSSYTGAMTCVTRRATQEEAEERPVPPQG